MGIGYALSEELVLQEPGVPTDRYLKLGVIKARDTPTITPVLVETGDPNGPWGAKGVGEIGLVPTAPAIAAALRSHDGRWRNVLPMKDSSAAKGVGVRLPRKQG
jgi:CO/xanthine dehydrogenase Mo-binding subunit